VGLAEMVLKSPPLINTNYKTQCPIEPRQQLKTPFAYSKLTDRWPCYAVVSLLFLIGPSRLYAQQTVSAERSFSVVHPDSTYFLDNWVLPGSIRVTVGDTLLSRDKWNFGEITGFWRWIPKGNERESILHSVTIQYRRYPYPFRREYYRRKLVTVDTSYISGDTTRSAQQKTKAPLTEEQLFGDVQLNKSGSLTRGFTIGTNKDLSLESGLRFDMNGKLTDNIDVLATLTDKSTPIQPEGSTQNLKEFDKVFIQMKSPVTTVQMGDVDLSLNHSEFARLNRRLQGASGAANTEYGNYKGAFSVERGRYRSMNFNGRDGVQGPYRLNGANNEEFIIVLAGSERVYIDGERVHRGEQNDYTIDYSLGEVNFTNNQIITDETRITVDFQYINRDFSRTLMAAEGQDDSLMNGKLSFGTTVIRSADSDNLANQLSLTPDEIDVLRKAGDDPDKAIVSGADSVGLRTRAEEFVHYSRIDTIYNGQNYQIYKSMPGDSTNVFRVHFTKVGEGEGAYRRMGQAVNGILYEWVGPGNGTYQPFRKLPAPQKHQMVSLRSSYRPTKNIKIYGEWSGSDLDKNRFSSLDDGNNFDHAYLAGLRVKDLKTGLGTVDANVRRRFSGRNFDFFDRTRPVEFDRKWNISGNEPVQEKISEANISLNTFKATNITAGLGQIDRDDMKGDRQEFTIQSNEAHAPNIHYQLERINSKDYRVNQNGFWVRQQGQTNYDLKTGIGTLTPSLGLESELRRQRTIQSDTLTPNSLKFLKFSPGISYKLDNFSLSAELDYRQDEKITDQQFQPESQGTTQRFRMAWSPGSSFNTRNELAFRNKTYTDRFQKLLNAKNSKGVFIRSNTNYAMKDHFLQGQLLYQANTERRAIMQETFVEVGPEFGQYVWEDMNDDGVQQIDEFFQELSPNEGIYVKQFVPSDELFPVIDLHARIRNQLDPSVLFGDDEPENLMGKLASKIRWNSLFEVRETNTTQRLKDIYLLNLSKFRNDSTTIDGQLYWQQDVRILPENRTYDIRLQANQTRGLNRKAVGLEKQRRSNYSLTTGYLFAGRYEITNEVHIGQNTNLSKRLVNRNYDIQSYSIVPGFNFTINRSAKVGFDISRAKKTDRFPPKNAVVDMWKITGTARIYLFGRLQNNLRFEWRSVKLNGESSSLGLYEMTEGAGEGKNFRWSIRSTYRVSDLIRATLNYDGRTVKEQSPIQTLRIVVSAVF